MKQTKKVPVLRFPGFEGEWVERKYSSIFSFKATNSYSRDKLNNSTGTVRNIHYGDIHTKFKTLFDLNRETAPYINAEIDLSRIPGDYYCQVGDLVIADASENYEDIGKCIEIINLNGEKVLAGLHTFLARPFESTIALGLSAYLMQSPLVRSRIKTIAQGTKVLGLSNKRLGDIEVYIPHLAEQQKIASFLSSVDDKIQQLQKKKELLQRYKNGVMQEIFNQEIRFKDDDGKEFPEWESKKLGELSKITTGSSNREDSSLSGKYTFFDRSQDIRTSNRFLFDAEAIIVPGEGQRFVPKYFVGKFDLHQRAYAIMNFKPNHGKFLFFYIDYNSAHLNSFAVGSTVKSLRLPMFQKMPLKLPCIAEQIKIANFLSSIDDKINLVNKQLDQAKQFKKGLLQQMFV